MIVGSRTGGAHVTFANRTFTIVGARSFIGSTVATYLEAAGARVVHVRHDEARDAARSETIIFCTGIASGAGRVPGEAYRLHVEVPSTVLARTDFDRFVYLSSTRVYDGLPSTREAEPTAGITHTDAYVRTKRQGEVAVLADPRGRVIRLSNVYGNAFAASVFLSDILKQAAQFGHVQVHSAPASEKDYVSVSEVAALIPLIARQGTERIYNLARGNNTTHAEIFAVLARLGISVAVPSDAPAHVFDAISIDRLRAEFPVPTRDVLTDLPALLEAFRTNLRGTQR